MIRKKINGCWSKYNDLILDHYNEYPNESLANIARRIIDEQSIDNNKEKCFIRHVQKTIQYQSFDKEIIEENIKLAKDKQKAQDINRIANKAFREPARVDNAIEEYSKELISILKKHNISKVTKCHSITKNKACGIFHFTDAHFNELISLEYNKYDFTIASQRCKEFVDRSRQYFKSFGVKNILFACTGDMMNSDRRLDELLNMATNRSKATFLAVYIIQQMLLDLNKDFNITVAYVTGNESRVRKDHEWSKIIATDNYDYTIFNTLKLLFHGSKGITFPDGDPSERVINVGGQNILMIHGNQNKTGSERDMQSIIGKYSKKGIQVDLIICGHIHSTYISDFFARSGSLPGANEYSEKALQLISCASQNIHIIFNKDKRDTIRIDLQDVSHVKGYNIIKELEAYNAKSAEKATKKETIFKVII